VVGLGRKEYGGDGFCVFGGMGARLGFIFVGGVLASANYLFSWPPFVKRILNGLLISFFCLW
jgi:hypothetical protein